VPSVCNLWWRAVHHAHLRPPFRSLPYFELRRSGSILYPPVIRAITCHCNPHCASTGSQGKEFSLPFPNDSHSALTEELSKVDPFVSRVNIVFQSIFDQPRQDLSIKFTNYSIANIHEYVTDAFFLFYFIYLFIYFWFWQRGSDRNVWAIKAPNILAGVHEG